jgi:hypothetical protein
VGLVKATPPPTPVPCSSTLKNWEHQYPSLMGKVPGLILHEYSYLKWGVGDRWLYLATVTTLQPTAPRPDTGYSSPASMHDFPLRDTSFTHGHAGRPNCHKPYNHTNCSVKLPQFQRCLEICPLHSTTSLVLDIPERPMA